jgi:hypothetical protein
MRAMPAVTPTTLAGIAAVARYCLGSEHLTESEFWTDDSRTESRPVTWFLAQQAARIE